MEVRGRGQGTGTYQIKVRVNNICQVLDGRPNYSWGGGPDSFTNDHAPNTSTRSSLGRSVSIGAYLGDNWEWYWDQEPDVDWIRLDIQSGQQYAIEAWADTDYATQHQARDLKILGIHDSDGNVIDGTASGSGQRVSVDFTPPTTGAYYVAVGSGTSDRTGAYRIGLARKSE